MKNTFKINLSVVLVCVVLFGACEVKNPMCMILSDAHLMSEKEVKFEENTDVGFDWAVNYNPLVLPVILRIDPTNGVSVIHTNQMSIASPIGTFGLEYSVASGTSKTINGHQITAGDYVVGIVDQKKGTKELFKIEGFNRLKVVTNGKTRIDAQAGYVEIDVTDAELQELKFIDNSQMSIKNLTDKPQKVLVGIKDISTSILWHECMVDPNSYKTFPRFGIQSYNIEKTEMFVKVENNDSNNDTGASIQKKVVLGEVCQISYNDDNTTLKLEKLLNK